MSIEADENRIRAKAHHLWISEGRPVGRDRDHWELARELIAIEDSQRSTLHSSSREGGEPVEPPEAFENQAETPGLTDQGEAMPGPTREAEAASANVMPDAPPRRDQRVKLGDSSFRDHKGVGV